MAPVTVLDMRNHWWRRGRAAACLAVLLALLTPTIGRAEAPWPGVPDDTLPTKISCPRDPAGCGLTIDWFGIQTRGLTQVKRARQWARIPLQAALVNFATAATAYYPESDPEGRLTTSATFANVFLSSPRGSAHGYGESLPFTVRTVAFGSIPVQARVQVVQARDERNLPIPFRTRLDQTKYRTIKDRSRYDPIRLSGQVGVQVLGLSVDGVDLGLAGSCRTTQPGALVLESPGGWVPDPPAIRTSAKVKAYADSLALHGIFSGGGGAISGTVDVPPFTGCRTTSGDDVSQLLTATVSGSNNPVSVSTPNLGLDSCWTVVPPLGFHKPRGPFQGDPTIDCDQIATPYDFPLPKRR
jgi:hypothetical protein